jgi:nucleolar protein 4
MVSKGDAQRALEKCNGMKIRAGIAEQFVQAKQKKKKQVRIEEKLSKEKARKGQEGAEEDAAGVERAIAVDWALSKDRWEEEKAKKEVDEDVEMSEGDGREGNESGDHSGPGSGSDEEKSPGDSSEEEEEEDEAEKPQKPQLPAPEVGTTLFVRNIPFEATEDELRVLWVVSSRRVLSQRSQDHAVSARLGRYVMRASRWTMRRVDPKARVSSAFGTSKTRTRSSRRAIFCAWKPLNRLQRYSLLCTME